jgi:hypothetical protein
VKADGAVKVLIVSDEENGQVLVEVTEIGTGKEPRTIIWTRGEAIEAAGLIAAAAERLPG